MVLGLTAANGNREPLAGHSRVFTVPVLIPVLAASGTSPSHDDAHLCRRTSATSSTPGTIGESFNMGCSTCALHNTPEAKRNQAQPLNSALLSVDLATLVGLMQA